MKHQWKWEFHLEILDKRISEFEVENTVIGSGILEIAISPERDDNLVYVNIGHAVDIRCRLFRPDPVRRSAEMESLGVCIIIQRFADRASASHPQGEIISSPEMPVFSVVELPGEI